VPEAAEVEAAEPEAGEESVAEEPVAEELEAPEAEVPETEVREAKPAEAEPAEAESESGAAAAAEPAAASPPPSLPPGTDLTRRLAAANAAAMSGPPVRETTWRDIVGPDQDDPDEAAEGGDADEQDRRRLRRRQRDRERDRAPVSREPDERPAVTPLRRVATDTETIERTETSRQSRSLLRTLISLVVVVVVVAAGTILLRAFVMSPYYIPSASMEPTLHGCTGCNNDHVLVNRLSYHLHDIHRGDVVVFHRPSTWQVSEKLLVKRVIGLPGDVLTTKAGAVYVNGLQLDEPYINDQCTGGTTNLTSSTVPAGSIFVMGDNRCQSEDSRSFGPVPRSAVVGRAFMIVWPFGRLHWI
jgi:signal peptidase I